ncbi:MAG: hypothetical protein ABIJ59_12135 [Pseudomonadota bacterium]
MKTFTKYFKIAGVTITVNSDLPITENTFHPKFKLFETDAPGKDNISIHHHFESPKNLDIKNAATVYDRRPWSIYRTDKYWIYKRVHEFPDKLEHHCTAFFNHSYTHVDIYNEAIKKEQYENGSLDSLTLFPTDQILLAKIFAHRNGCFFHSNGVILDNKGFLFLGHSGYGKSTIAKMVEKIGGQIVCDDRILTKKVSGQIKIYGTWCHGKEQIYSSKISLLNAIFFLNKANTNEIVPITDNKQRIHQLLSYIIKPLVTKDWWEHNFNLIEFISQKVPCYNLKFDKSGEILDLIRKIE